MALFTTANEQKYYRHLLLLEDLDGLLSSNLDLEEFHGARSANIDSSIDRTLRRIAEVAADLEANKSWYCKTLVPKSTARPGSLMTGMRARIKSALPSMTSQEKLLVGLSYAGYSDASDSIHYSLNRHDIQLSGGQEKRHVATLGTLTFGILNRCHELLGRPKVPIIDQLSETLSKSDPHDTVRKQTVRAVEAGDFVLAYGCLGEVLEVRETSFGYQSYRIGYLAEKLLPEIDDEWLAARYVQILVTRTKAIGDLRQAIQDGKLPQALLARLESADPEQLQKKLRESMVATWQAGHREWVAAERDRQQRSG